MAWSIAASIILHILALLLSPLVVRLEAPPGATATAPPDAPDAFGLEAIVAIPSENAPESPAEEPAPVEQPRVTPPRVTSQPDTPTPARDGPPPTVRPGDQTRPSARDALRPGYRDSRLYVAPNEYPELSKTEHEVYMEHLEARINAVNDSMYASSARNRTTSDWTYTDSDGDRWGLSPEGLHLGGVTIPRAVLPLPGATGDNARIGEERERQRQRDEIQRQEEDRARRDTRNERIDATRDANDAARQNGGS